MIVCPVCEHAQPQGAECEVCGKRLVPGPTAADLAIPSVEGLEPTLHAPSLAAEERIAELEPTRHAFAVDLPDVMPDFEATRTEPVDVDVEPAPDIEQTSEGIPGDAPTALPSIAVCRYCRTPAMPGERICSRCGMRLPVLGAAAAEAPPAVRICSCGTAIRGSLCPTCGARTG
jgi:hypothetical protein